MKMINNSDNSKKISLVLLGLTALACSRVLFAIFNDPEGPNLLVVVGMAAILYAVSVAVYAALSSLTGKRFLLAVLVQLLLGAVFYFCLR